MVQALDEKIIHAKYLAEYFTIIVITDKKVNWDS